MVRVFVRVGFGVDVGFHFDALGSRFDVETPLGAIEVALPEIVWGSDSRPSIRRPNAASNALDQFGESGLLSRDEVSWGMVRSFRTDSPEGQAGVDAVLASIEVDRAVLDYAERVDDRKGSIKGETVRQLRKYLDDWRALFVEWVSVIAGQPASSMRPPIPPGALWEAPNTIVWAEEEGALVGQPSLQNHEGGLTIVAPAKDETLGFVLNASLRDRVLALTMTGERPSIQLSLLQSARIAIRRNDYRLAVIELGSAAEICLWSLFDQDVPKSTPTERASWTLGRLINKTFPASDPRRGVFHQKLVVPRNNAVHRADPLDRSRALEAFALTRELVSDELVDPLPFV